MPWAGSGKGLPQRRSWRGIHTKILRQGWLLLNQLSAQRQGDTSATRGGEAGGNRVHDTREGEGEEKAALT